MRLSVCCLLLPVLAVSARAAIVEEWNQAATVLASGELDGSPGLELVVDNGGQLNILDAGTGMKEYDFDPAWSGFAAPEIWIRDVDQDGAGEVLIALQSSPVLGLIRHNGSSFLEAWSIPGLAPDLVEFANVTGSANLELVLDVGPLHILDALSGGMVYDSTQSIGLNSLLSMEVADWGGDGLDDVLARFNNGLLYLVSDDIAVGLTGPSTVQLSQNRPNPAAGSTSIAFSLSEPGRARLRIYDSAGRLVRELLDGRLPSGGHSVSWDGRDGRARSVASGVYYYELDAGDHRRTRKMLRLK